MPKTLAPAAVTTNRSTTVSFRVAPFTRQLLLGAALVAAIIVGLKPAPAAQMPYPMLLAQATPKAAAPTASTEITGKLSIDSGMKGQAAVNDAANAAARDSAETQREAARVAAEAAKDGVDITINRHGVQVDDGRTKKKVHVGLGGSNRDYDSFEDFIHQEPWVGALVFGIVAIIFMVPVLIIGLVIWYKLRKTRMMNETMVKLAEHGVVPASEAVSAIATGRVDATMKATMAAAPVYEQARFVRKSVAWSDLRKGVLMVAVGLSIAFYSMLADGEPNWLGLVLIFVGIAYSGLWFFESRAIDNALDKNARPQPPAGGV